MTGKQIAANLKKTRIPWSPKGLIYMGRSCVLGIKAREAGVGFDTLVNLRTWLYAFASSLYKLNDKAGSKQELIESLLLPENARRNFPVERFIKLCEQKERNLARKNAA